MIYELLVRLLPDEVMVDARWLLAGFLMLAGAIGMWRSEIR